MRSNHKIGVSFLVGVTLVAVLVTEPGCSSPARRSVVGSSVSNTGEPGLTPESSEPSVAVVEPGVSSSTNSTKTVGFVDRHPLLRKPQQYYDNTKSNKFVKTAAAAVVGVPAGIVGELKQIVVGKPSTSTY